MNPNALLVETLGSIQELSSNVFFSTLTATVQKILNNVSCIYRLKLLNLDECSWLQSTPS